jgi:short-subunit dehydrogenase
LVSRCSEATTTASPRPAAAISSAASSAEVAARWEQVMSRVRRLDVSRLAASATTTEFWRSAKGSEVDASNSAAGALPGTRPMASAKASVAMVMASSSQLHMAFSPLARPRRPESNQALASAITCFCSRARGR